MEQQTIKSPTNSSYYGEHSPNLNGVIGNIHLVRAKTEDVVGPYEVHQMGLKSSSLAQLGEEMHVIHHHHNSHPHDSNNNSTHNSIEPFLNIVPPPPHLAAELGRKCMAFNAEQVTIQKQVSDWLEDRRRRGEKSRGGLIKNGFLLLLRCSACAKLSSKRATWRSWPPSCGVFLQSCPTTAILF